MWQELLSIVGVFALCVASWAVVAIPSGRVIERFTKEPLAARLWQGLLLIFAIFVFVGMSGVATFVRGLASKRIESTQASAQFALPEVPEIRIQ